jgi:hypothetical protein
MSTFADAIKKGLEAHDAAVKARETMDSVLAAASAEISAVVGIEVALRFADVPRPLKRYKNPILDVARGLASVGQEFMTAVVANAKGGSAVLAEAELSQVGFPVTLRWGDHYADVADNRESFESAVKALLEHAQTGERIAELVHGSAIGGAG